MSEKEVICKVIVTPGGSFLEGEYLVKKLKALANNFESPQRKERFLKVQDHHSLYQGLPANPGDTRVTSMTEMFQKCHLYYHGLKLFWENIKNELDECDGPNPKHDDKLFVTILDAVLKREWQAVQKMDAITFQLASYANNEAHTNWVMASWIVFLRHKTSNFISSTIFQVISFEKKPRSTDSQKKSICRRVQVKAYELNEINPKCLLRWKHQIQIWLPKQPAKE